MQMNTIDLLKTFDHPIAKYAEEQAVASKRASYITDGFYDEDPEEEYYRRNYEEDCNRWYIEDSDSTLLAKEERERLENTGFVLETLDVDRNKVYNMDWSYVSYDSWSPSERTFDYRELITGDEVLDIIGEEMNERRNAYSHNFNVTEVTASDLKVVLKRTLMLLSMVDPVVKTEEDILADEMIANGCYPV